MKYTPEEVLLYLKEEDVKFVRMSFCDPFGRQKNVAIMADELPRAFEYGIGFDASAIDGFNGEVRSDLFLQPDPSTLVELPWRPQHGRVCLMFCNIFRPDGSPFPSDTRRILAQAVQCAEKMGYSFAFGTEMEFYLFKTDETGNRTMEPLDQAGYMDIAPDDRGENVRREICLTLERMGMHPEASHHESGPGQNEIDFRYADPISAADHAVLFRSVVKTIASLNGLWADFSPRPLSDFDGSGMHINISARKDGRGKSKRGAAVEMDHDRHRDFLGVLLDRPLHAAPVLYRGSFEKGGRLRRPRQFHRGHPAPCDLPRLHAPHLPHEGYPARFRVSRGGAQVHQLHRERP